MSAEGRKIIQILKSQGLFFSNALSAAKALNKINDYKMALENAPEFKEDKESKEEYMKAKKDKYGL